MCIRSHWFDARPIQQSHIRRFSPGLVSCPATVLDPMWVSTCRVDLESVQTVVGYSHDTDATVATVGVSLSQVHTW